MADLFEKRGAVSFGSSFASDAAPQTLETLHGNDPLSSQFHHNVKNTRDLVRYMIALQVQRYGRQVDLPVAVLAGHARAYAKLYGIEVLVRGICYASRVSEFPFSLAFVVRKIVPQMRDRCPFLTQQSTNSPTAASLPKKRRGSKTTSRPR